MTRRQKSPEQLRKREPPLSARRAKKAKEGSIRHDRGKSRAVVSEFRSLFEDIVFRSRASPASSHPRSAISCRSNRSRPIDTWSTSAQTPPRLTWIFGIGLARRRWSDRSAPPAARRRVSGGKNPVPGPRLVTLLLRELLALPSGPACASQASPAENILLNDRAPTGISTRLPAIPERQIFFLCSPVDNLVPHSLGGAR